MIVDDSLNQFDLSFLSNWVQKKYKGRYWRADEQARSLAILYSNRLGQRSYQELAPLLHGPAISKTSPED